MKNEVQFLKMKFFKKKYLKNNFSYFSNRVIGVKNSNVCDILAIMSQFGKYLAILKQISFWSNLNKNVDVAS